MNHAKHSSRLGVLFLVLSCASMLGCGHEVSAQHFEVTLDDDGARYQGSMDFPGYFSGGGCATDSESSKDPDEKACTPTALSVGSVEGISQIASAEIDLDKSTDGPEYVIEIVNDDTEKFTCWMQPRDIGHAFECTSETGTQGALATITLSPVS